MGNQPSKLNLKEQGVADALSVKGSTFYEETIPLALECFANTVTIFHYLEHICHPALLAPLTKQRFSIGQWIVVVDLTEVVPLFMKSKGFSVSLMLIPCPNWTMQTVPIRHFGGNFLVWFAFFM